LAFTLTGYSPLSYVQHIRTPDAIKVRKRGSHGTFPDRGRRGEMLKRFIDPIWFGLGCLVLLIWQLSVPAYAQAPAKNAWRKRAQ
jgi:hypothetical protein